MTKNKSVILGSFACSGVFVCTDVTWRAPVVGRTSTAAAGPRRPVVMATSRPGHVHSVAHT